MGDASVMVGALTALARRATEPFDLGDILGALADAAAQVVPGAGAAVTSAAAADRPHAVHASNERVEALERLQDVLQQGPAVEALRQLSPVVAPALTSDPRWPQLARRAGRLGITSAVSIPLLGRGQAWGTLTVYRDSSGDLPADDLADAQHLAQVGTSYVVLAVDRHAAEQAHRILGHRLMHDELTGLANRALLHDRLTHALSAAARHRRPLSVLYIDLDDFKSVNDTHGHAAGDALLVEVAERLTAAVRDGDTLARLAGDEFVIICEDLHRRDDDHRSSTEVVAGLVARIRDTLSQPARVQPGTTVTIAASIGVTTAVPDGHTAESLLREADQAMYLDKRRDRHATDLQHYRSRQTRRTSP